MRSILTPLVSPLVVPFVSHHRRNLYRQNLYRPLNRIEISARAYENNLRILAHHTKKRVIPVLKSNAYGHGLEEVGKIVDKLGIELAAVDSFQEAMRLRASGVKTRSLITGAIRPELLRRPWFGISGFPIRALALDLAVSSLELSLIAVEHQPQIGLHLFIDTGMCREGVSMNELRTWLRAFRRLPQARLKGVMSHLSDADRAEGRSFTIAQRKRFAEAVQIVQEEGFSPSVIHLDASAGAMGIETRKHSTHVRVGLASYGYAPMDAPVQKQLQSVARVMSCIVQIKELPIGSEIGYGRTAKVSRKTRIGLLPIGYADGVPRELSNLGMVRIISKHRNKQSTQYAPILGRVSMNLTTIDLSAVFCELWDEVEVIGWNRDTSNGLLTIAKQTRLLPYELLIHLNSEMRREVVT